MPFLQRIIRVGNPKQKMAKKNSWSKSRQAVLFLLNLFCSPLYERESWRDERLRDSERDTRADTHTHRERERETVCYCAFCESYKRERARERLTLFSFFCVTSELIQTRERKEV